MYHYQLYCLIIINGKIEDKNNKIVAEKNEIEGKSEKKIKYTIKFKDYNIQEIVKTIECDEKDIAQIEYNRYQIINEFESKGYQLEMKNKTIKMILTQELFVEDIEYDETKNITLIAENGKQTKIVNQEEIINCLINQGYTIK